VKRRFDGTTKRGENYAKRAQDNTAGAKRASRARRAMEREQRGSTQPGTQRELYLSCSGPARVIMSIHVGTDSVNPSWQAWVCSPIFTNLTERSFLLVVSRELIHVERHITTLLENSCLRAAGNIIRRQFQLFDLFAQTVYLIGDGRL
jgi:hypothetical protein